MGLVINCLMLTGLVVLAPIITRDKKAKLFVYIMLFWAFLLLFVCFSNLDGKEIKNNGSLSFSEQFKEISPKAFLTQDQREFCISEISRHEWNGRKFLKDAEERCWMFPDTSSRDKAKYCFSAAMAAAVPGTPMTRIIAGLLVLFGQYGLDCMDEIEAIEKDLMRSQYHFEMKEFFEVVLIHG